MIEWRQPERPLLARSSASSCSSQAGSSSPPNADTCSRPAISPSYEAGCACAQVAGRGPRRAAAGRLDLRPGRRGPDPPRRGSQDGRRRNRRSPGRAEQPELAAAETARMIEDEASARAAPGRASPPRSRRRSRRSPTGSTGRPAPASRRRSPTRRPPLEERDWIAADLHLHTSWSHDCSIDVDELLDTRRSEGPRRDRGHGPQRLRRCARGRRARPWPSPGGHPGRGDQNGRAGRGDRALPAGGDPAGHVVRGDHRRDPRSGGPRLCRIRSTGCTRSPGPRRCTGIWPRSTCRGVQRAAALRGVQQGGRFARKYNLTPGAGSDAHVLAGVGTGAVRMRRFSGPEEFLVSSTTPRCCAGRSRSSICRG